MTLVDKNATRNYIFWNTNQLEYSLHRQMILVPVKNGSPKNQFFLVKNQFVRSSRWRFFWERTMVEIHEIRSFWCYFDILKNFKKIPKMNLSRVRTNFRVSQKSIFGEKYGFLSGTIFCLLATWPVNRGCSQRV